MNKTVKKVFKLAGLTVLLSACALPRPGPNKSEIFQANFNETSRTQVVVVDDRINSLTTSKPQTQFPSSLLSSSTSSSDIFRPGDVISLSILEATDDRLFAGGEKEPTILDELQVDDSGFIYVPFIGRVRAAGNSPEALRSLVTRKFVEAGEIEPEVWLQRGAGDGATVSVLGDGIAAQGVYQIQRSNRNLTDLMATAGGLTAPAEVVRVTLLRGSHKGDLWFEDIYKSPSLNFALRAGDQVLIQRDPRSYTILGATGAQTNELFSSRQPNALEAVAQVGGLVAETADPTGIFVIREQSAEFANRLLQRNDIVNDQNIVYVLDLTQPNGIPLARGFDIKDGDTIYVTEAPSVLWNKALNNFRGPLSQLLLLDRLADD